MNKMFLLLMVLAVVIFLFRGMARADDAAAEAWQRIGAGALVIDVRSAEEYATGHLEGSLNIVHDQTASLAKAIGDDKGRSVVVYCRSGRRSGIALQALAGLGYTNVFNAGGYTALHAAKPARE